MTRASALGLLLWCCSAALLVWILKGLPIDAMLLGLRQLSFTQWSVWVALNLIVMALSTLRWHSLITALSGAVGFFALVLIRLGGQTISFVTPGPQFGGEPLQIFWLYKQQGLALHKAVLSLGLDRFYELWVNFAVLLLGAMLLLLSPNFGFADWGQIALVLLGLLILISFLFIALMRRPQWMTRRLRPLLENWLRHPRLARLNAHREAFEDDVRELLKNHRRVLLQALTLSLVTWGFILAELWLLLGFAQVEVELRGFTLIAVSIRLAMLLPLPGGIGTIEAALIWSTQLLGFEISDALVLIALMRVRDALLLCAGATSLIGLRARSSEAGLPR